MALVELKGISKSFAGVYANNNVDFAVFPGEIHALLGENGAGKSTLMNVLNGIYQPDSGEIHIDGKRVEFRSPFDSKRFGVGMVHQHFIQSERHTALQNIILGQHDLAFFPDTEQLALDVNKAAKEFGLKVDLNAKIGQMPVGDRQKVEIIRALYHGARILVLDEPTAVLSRQETSALFDILRLFVKKGFAVIFISHKLDEVLEISDRVSVLRKGCMVGTYNNSGLTAKDLAQLMVGRDLVSLQKKPHKPGHQVLAFDKVTLNSELLEVSFKLFEGEILGIAGVAGSGQAALADLAAGYRSPSSGKIQAFCQNLSRGFFRKAGISYIPEDRHKVGVAASLSVVDNLLLLAYKKHSRFGVINWRKTRSWADSLVKKYNIKTSGLDAQCGGLSGGNIQKVILARELNVNPKILIAAYPARGLDVGSAEEIRAELLALRDRGGSVLLISEDLAELLSLSDRIGVLFRGKLSKLYPAEDLTKEQIGMLMGGAS